MRYATAKASDRNASAEGIVTAFHAASSEGHAHLHRWGERRRRPRARPPPHLTRPHGRRHHPQPAEGGRPARARRRARRPRRPRPSRRPRGGRRRAPPGGRLRPAPAFLAALAPPPAPGAVPPPPPDPIVPQMTALAGPPDLRRFERTFAPTNRLRTEGTDHLLEAARAAGVERFLAQGYAGWPYARTGGPVKTEDDPLDPDPPKAMRSTLEAMRHLEAAVTGAGGTILRYGGFYGPGTGLEPGGDQWEMIRRRKFPIVGDGGGVWSFCHVEDAAGATRAALEHPAPGGIFNVCDDDPAAVREWLPAMAAAIGGPPPPHVPRWLGRL